MVHLRSHGTFCICRIPFGAVQHYACYGKSSYRSGSIHRLLGEYCLHWMLHFMAYGCGQMGSSDLRMFIMNHLILKSIFPPHLWIIIAATVSFIINIIGPIVRSYQHDRLHKDKEQFDLIIQNPSLLEVFKQSTVPDFTFHYVVFEYHLQEIMKQASELVGMNNVPSDTPVDASLRGKYGDIVRLYFCYDSPFMVLFYNFNISSFHTCLMK